MDLVEKWDSINGEVSGLISDLYQCYPKGFYVNAERRMKDTKGGARYIGHYLARPTLAEYRITHYDGETVEFWYEDHQTGKRIDVKVTVYEFLRKLLQHIPLSPLKHFRMVVVLVCTVDNFIKKRIKFCLYILL